jgi:hypothetical protein
MDQVKYSTSSQTSCSNWSQPQRKHTMQHHQYCYQKLRRVWEKETRSPVVSEEFKWRSHVQKLRTNCYSLMWSFTSSYGTKGWGVCVCVCVYLCCLDQEFQQCAQTIHMDTKTRNRLSHTNNKQRDARVTSLSSNFMWNFFWLQSVTDSGQLEPKNYSRSKTWFLFGVLGTLAQCIIRAAFMPWSCTVLICYVRIQQQHL